MVALLLAAPAAGTGVLGAGDGVRVESVSSEGESVVTPAEKPFIWQADSHTFTVSVAAETGIEDAAVCLLANSSTGPRELACRNVSFKAGTERDVRLTVDAWPSDVTGPRTLAGIVRNRTAESRIASLVVPVFVLQASGDLDGDGLTNEVEVERGTALRDPDSDDDGLADAVEVRVHGTAPLRADSDGDGLDDGQEVYDYNTDPLAGDTDGDGLPDGREVERGTVPTSGDTDGDGLDDGAEVNRYQTDPKLADTDGDGLSDGAEIDGYDTDPTDPDTDDDGLTDGQEVTVHETDPLAADTDGDGLSDNAELTVHYTDPSDPDTDGDGLEDAAEIEDFGTGPYTVDSDRDGLSDGREVALGSNPTDPSSTAQPGLARRALWTITDRPLLSGLVVGISLVVGLIFVVRGTDRPSAGLGDRRSTEPEADDSDASDAVGNEPVKEAPDSPTPSDEARIMTNEERVVHLLEQHDGRMLQSEMVEAADWSKATVSRVLSRMEQAGAVSRVDIGRGNLVTRPEDEPPSVDSPFDT